ncbi:hypothetical protein LMH87_005077 [Akanthomyces muscarius]|uniref:PinX1-related protein 1 n=1 Tax=Akanthomyces muscarius TaxID=2231603 RepID=A0A9W8UNX4_AKAMU|nr:hypothetical protein LMH87_005077 [Akanthomyces muscarius]KAJ4163342.1 hypothetical protein LMH87_005077 [Akanthomyces muscarius]
MGLLQDSKSRKKISNDPNNTKWTRDTTTFGQKILRAQGWQPGQFLGAQDAPHAELHSAASASYIRVVLKDDMKGLGFNKAKEDEVTGLDVFSDLLSRLNGKSEAAVQEDVNARLAVKTNRYVEMRWGPMRFVRGGLLVGDKLKEDGGKETSTESEEEEEEDEAKADEVAKSKKDKKSKKRKAGDEVEEAEGSEVTETKDKKRRRKDEDEDARAERKKRRKEEKKEKKKSKKSSKSTKEESDEDDSDGKAAKKRAKRDKKDKKRERREKKEEKKRRKAAKVADNSSDNSSSSDSDSDNDNGDSTTAASTPAAGSGTSTPLGNRNFSRSRYIAQKRRAVMDAKALAQIFMVKA